MKKSLGYPEDQTNSGPHSAGLLRTQFYLKKKICKAGGGYQTQFIPFGVESPQHLPSQEPARSCWVTGAKLACRSDATLPDYMSATSTQGHQSVHTII